LNRSVARWLAENPVGAMFVTAALALLPGLALLLPGALVVFVTLQRGPRIGGIVALGATVLLAALGLWSPNGKLPDVLVLPGALLGPPLLLAVVLARSQSLSLCLQIGVLLAIATILVLHAAHVDPEPFWQPLRRVLEEFMTQAGVASSAESKAVLDVIGRRYWGWLVGHWLLLAMCAVFLGRKWQANEVEPGGFGAEFRMLRLGLALGSAAAVFIGLAIWLGNDLIYEIAIVFFVALLLIGLAAAHRFRARSGLHVAWLWVMYIGLFVVGPLMVAILVTWGFVDNWLRSTRPAAAT
jgi:hypothetical protein